MHILHDIYLVIILRGLEHSYVECFCDIVCRIFMRNAITKRKIVGDLPSAFKKRTILIRVVKILWLYLISVSNLILQSRLVEAPRSLWIFLFFNMHLVLITYMLWVILNPSSKNRSIYNNEIYNTDCLDGAMGACAIAVLKV